MRKKVMIPEYDKATAGLVKFYLEEELRNVVKNILG